MMRSPLLAALFVLWAGTETSLCLSPCPSHCSARFGFTDRGQASFVQGVKASAVIDTIQQLERIERGAKMTYLVIAGKRVRVPSSMKVTIERTVRQHPGLASILIVVLRDFKPRTPPRRRKNVKQHLKGREPRRPYRRPPPLPTRPSRPRKIPPKPPVRPSMILKIPLAKPEFPVYDITHPVFLEPDLKGISDRVRFWLELLFNQPNYFPVIYRVLIQLGVKFPDVRGPIENVVVGGGVNVRLPHSLMVKYRVKVNGKTFQLPKDSKKLAIHISKHPESVAVVLSHLGHLGATFSVDHKGMIKSFRVFNVTYTLPKPVGTQLALKGRTYVLPRDLQLIIDALKDKPADFVSIQIILRAFGVKFKKTPDKYMQAIRANRPFGTIKMPKNVRVRVKDKYFDIPADLETILYRRQDVNIGELLAALQRARIPLKVDEGTGVVLGIVVDKVVVPFPLTIDLRFKMGKDVYKIPRDLKIIISHLERKGMPSRILHVLYTRYGVIPVRNSAGIVIALSFNGIEYRIKAEKPTTVAVLGRKFLLPQESEKMVAFVASQGKHTLMPLLKALQLAGYVFIPDSNGELHTIQKGAQIISLGMRIRIILKLGDVSYRMPFDLPRLVKVIKGLSSTNKKSVLRQLEAFGVQVIKKGRKLIILFNSIKYELDA